jgi:hypothetical protein
VTCRLLLAEREEFRGDVAASSLHLISGLWVERRVGLGGKHPTRDLSSEIFSLLFLASLGCLRLKGEEMDL